jgi:hypothetical protein
LTRILDGTCEGGTVTVHETPVDGPIILSEGQGASEGVLFFEKGKTYYIAKTSPDLETTLSKIVDALGAIASGIDSLDTRGFLVGATGAVIGPPTLSSTVAEINSLKDELNTLKGALK